MKKYFFYILKLLIYKKNYFYYQGLYFFASSVLYNNFRRMHNETPYIIFFIFIVWFCLSGVNAQMYYWVDKDGVKHYSNRNVSQDAETYKTIPEIEIEDDEKIEIDDKIEEISAEQKIELKKDENKSKYLSKKELDKMESECIAQETSKWIIDHEPTFIGDTPNDNYVIKVNKRNEENAKEYAKDICAKRRLQLELTNEKENEEIPMGNENKNN